MRLAFPLVAASFLLPNLTDPAAAAGAWETWLRAEEFTALLATDDDVWGATAEAGLLRWNRATQTFEVIRREPGSIAGNRLTSLALDGAGQLWVGTVEGGASFLRTDGRWSLLNTLDGLPSAHVTTLEAAGDTVWIGTIGGLALWNGAEIAGSLPDEITLSFDSTFTDPSVTGIVMTGDSLWVATVSGIGLARISTLLSDWRPVNDGLPASQVDEMAFDSRDLFARVGQQVVRWRVDLMRWEVEAALPPVLVLTDVGREVIAAGALGAFRWTRSATDSGWVAIPDVPPPAFSSVHDPEITRAPDGQYMAASGETLYVQPAVAGPWAPFLAPPGPPGNNLLHVGVQDGKVYVTTQNRGIGRLWGDVWRHWPPVLCSGAECDTTFTSGLQALGFLIDRQGRKWVASWSWGIDSFDDSVSPPDFVHHLIATDFESRRRTWVVSAAADSQGGRWFGMDSPLVPDVDPIGLEYYDAQGIHRRNYQPSNSSMSGNFVHALTVSRNGRLWIGYVGQGLDFVVLPDSGLVDSTEFRHVNATNLMAIRGLATYGDSIWAVTGGALLRFNDDATENNAPVERRPLRGAQPALAVKPLAVGPEGRVWLGTDAGLFTFAPGGAVDSFDVNNSPLPDNEVRSVAVDPVSGEIWIATASGLARYDPFFTPPPVPPRTRLSVRLYPNPAQLTALGIRLRLQGDAESYAGEIFDLSGRRLRRFTATNGALIWDGTDDHGRLVDPGIYFVRASAGGASAVARVTLLR